MGSSGERRRRWWTGGRCPRPHRRGGRGPLRRGVPAPLPHRSGGRRSLMIFITSSACSRSSSVDHTWGGGGGSGGGGERQGSGAPRVRGGCNPTARRGSGGLRSAWPGGAGSSGQPPTAPGQGAGPNGVRPAERPHLLSGVGVRVVHAHRQTVAVAQPPRLARHPKRAQHLPPSARWLAGRRGVECGRARWAWAQLRAASHAQPAAASHRLMQCMRCLHACSPQRAHLGERGDARHARLALVPVLRALRRAALGGAAVAVAAGAGAGRGRASPFAAAAALALAALLPDVAWDSGPVRGRSPLRHCSLSHRHLRLRRHVLLPPRHGSLLPRRLRAAVHRAGRLGALGRLGRPRRAAQPLAVRAAPPPRGSIWRVEVLAVLLPCCRRRCCWVKGRRHVRACCSRRGAGSIAASAIPRRLAVRAAAAVGAAAAWADAAAGAGAGAATAGRGLRAAAGLACTRAARALLLLLLLLHGCCTRTRSMLLSQQRRRRCCGWRRGAGEDAALLQVLAGCCLRAETLVVAVAETQHLGCGAGWEGEVDTKEQASRR